MQEIQQIFLPLLWSKTLGSCKEKQTRHRNPRSYNKKRNVNSNKWYNNYNNKGKRYIKEKVIRRKKIQIKTNKKQGKYNNNKDYTNNKYKWLTINEIQERIKKITSEWKEGEYEEILKKYEGKRKRWYNILQEVYSIKKKKIIEKTKEEFKEKTKYWEEKDIKAIEAEIKNKNPIKEMNDRCKFTRIINETESIKKIQEETKNKEEKIEEEKEKEEIIALKNQITELKEKLKELSMKRMEEEQAISEEMMRKAKEIVKKEFEEEITEMKTQNRKIQTNYEEMKKENEKLEERNLKLQGKINEIEGKKITEVNNKEEKIRSIQANKKKMEKENEEMKEEIEKLKKRNKTLEQNANTLEKKIEMIEENTKELKKEIRDKEKQISEYQEIAIKNQEIAEITREELDNTQKENETQKQIISKQQDDIENFISQKELEKKKTMTLMINTQPVLRKASSGTMEMNETTPMKKTVVEIEEKSTDCQKTRDDSQTRNTTNQTNRILIEVLYCFEINWLNRKLYKKLRWEQIESIIKVTNINVNNENEYIKYNKISHKIKESTKRYIKMKVNDIIEGRVECDSIIKNILKNNSTEIDEEYLNTLINKIKEMKIEKCSNINYYWKRKEADRLIMEINNRWIMSGSRMQDLQDDMKNISMVMHLYLQNKIIGDKFDEIKEILKKINRLEDLVKGNGTE
ncbi:hypothetical protein, conserved [Entamoeba histolytica]